MKSEGVHSRIRPGVLVAFYVCAGVGWLWAQAWIHAYFGVSANQRPARWQIAMFAAWLLITALIGAWLLVRKRSAEGVRQETALELALVARHAPAGIARVRLDGSEIVWANARLAGWLGRSADSLQGESFRLLVPADDPQEVALHMASLVAGDCDHFQMLRSCVNVLTQKVTPVLCTASRMQARDGDGPVALVCVLQDLTEVLAARQALERSETTLRLALEGSGNGVWEWDGGMRHFHCSKGVAGMLRYRGSDLKRDFDFFSRLHPEDRPRARSMARSALKQSREILLMARLLCFDSVYRWFKVHGQSRVDAEGRLQRLSGLLADQTASRDAEERQRLAAAVVDNTIEGVVVTDAQSRILSANRSFTRLMGYAEEEILGQTPRMFKSGLHSKAFYEGMWAGMRATGHWQGEIWNRRKSGEVFPERMSLSAVQDATGAVTHYVCMFTDISNDKARERQLEFLSQSDVLTGLHNRARFEGLLGEAVERARASHGGMAVMLLNIDRFKDVNDSYGHAVGDMVLKHVAQQVQGALRHGDVLGRLAGDELAVVCQGLDGREDAIAVAEHLIRAAARPWTSPDGLSVVVGLSVGISLYPEHALDTKELMRDAHAAVYGAKARGSGTWCFFSEGMTQAARERLALEARLRRALDLGHLCLYYQPQIELATGRLIGAEALLRWLDPEEGVIPPARFIPVAESSSLIGPLGLWVLKEACRQGRQWHQAGLPALTIAVNVSLHQLLLTDLAGATQQVLAETGYPAQRLELEITESALAEHPEEAMQVLNRLRELGVHLAIDDFGTGYSSLAHLKRFPLDLLKIDQGFIRDIPHSADDMAISSSVIALGHAMGLKVLAEGVETREQLDFLRQKGCDFFQGYLCSRPLPAQDFTRLLEKVGASAPLVGAP